MSFQDNILFGKIYNEQWYKKVIDACALDNDIKVYPNISILIQEGFLFSI